MGDFTANSPVRTHDCPKCPGCSTEGAIFHEGLVDQLFGAGGAWNLRRCNSSHCRMLWLDPTPLEEDLPLLYADYHTHTTSPPPPGGLLRGILARANRGYLRARYGYQPTPYGFVDLILGGMLRLHPGRRADADVSVYHMPCTPNGTLLEVGCGAGNTLSALKILGWEVEGLDFDARAVETARKRGLNIHLGDLASQKYPPSRFDGIVLSHVIEHVPDAHSLLAECLRVLKPNGRLVVYTPNGTSLGHRVFKRYWRGLEPPRHLQVFTLAALSAMAVRVGFKLIACTSEPRARGIVRKSLRLKAMERQEESSFFKGRWVGELFEVGEALLLAFDRNAGEEAVLIATKC